MVEPMYRQIAEDLRHQIELGTLAPGDQLGTELVLQERYNASRNTVRDAVKWLITRGLVETRPGQGTFVQQEIIPFVTTLTGDPGAGGDGSIHRNEAAGASRHTPVFSVPRVEIRTADARIAGELHAPAGVAVVSRHQDRYIDDVPWSRQTSYYPMSLVERGALRLIDASDLADGTVEYLRQSLGISQVGYRDMVVVRPPDATEARFFRLPDDGRVVLIEIRETGFAADGTPFRLTVSVYPADRNRFAVNVGEVPNARTSPATGHQAKMSGLREAGGRSSSERRRT